MITKIYGASDDLVEIDGAVCEEHDCYDHKRPIKITCSDGTIGTIFYGGEWKIKMEYCGTKFLKLIESVGDDGTHENEAKNCTSYSDVLILNDGIEWVKIGSKTYK